MPLAIVARDRHIYRDKTQTITKMLAKETTTVKMTRRDFSNRLLAFCSCLLGVGGLDCSAKTFFNGKADELLYFLRQFTDIRNMSVCLVGEYSHELLLKCFDALEESNVRFLLENRKLFLLQQPREEIESVTITKWFSHKGLRAISIDALEEAHFENLLSVVCDVSGNQIVSDATLQRVLKTSKSSIIVTSINRVANCTFLPVESCAWDGKIMTIGERAIVVTGIGKDENEIG